MSSDHPFEPPANPYEPPVTDASPVSEGGGLATGPMLLLLRQTGPWVRLLAAIGYLGSGLLVVAGLAVGGFALAGEGTGLPAWAALAYLASGLVLGAPVVSLHRYGRAIRRAVHAGGTDQVEDALRQQLWFWRLVGALSLFVVLGYVAAALLLFGVLRAG
jgi:hypothetical protein